MVQQTVGNTSPEATQEAVKQTRTKGRKKVEKKASALSQLRVEYVDINSINPNDYNPNRQSEHDFELLLRSIEEDGFTQPIIAHKETRNIVDGEHRWRAAGTLGYEEIPVVFVDMPIEQMKIATLRHNRARGSEDVELSAQVLRDLQELGALDWAQDSLAMDDEEMRLMMEDVAAPDAMAEDEYTEAWEVTEASDEGTGEGDTQGRTTSMTPEALNQTRAQEQKMAQATSEEEKEIIRKETDIYRLSLTFSGDEAKVVRSHLSEEGAQKVLDWCRENATE